MSENQENRVISPGDVDDFLRELVNGVNDLNTVGFYISLMVGGLVVSGQLVGRRLYVDAVFDLLKIEREKTDAPERTEDKQGSTPSPLYIHLKDARVFHPGSRPLPSNQGVWWRGRINAVDAFWLGKVSAE